MVEVPWFVGFGVAKFYGDLCLVAANGDFCLLSGVFHAAQKPIPEGSDAPTTTVTRLAFFVVSHVCRTRRVKSGAPSERHGQASVEPTLPAKDAGRMGAQSCGSVREDEKRILRFAQDDKSVGLRSFFSYLNAGSDSAPGLGFQASE